MQHYDQLRAVVSAAALIHECESSIGYIGNCGPSFDDRLWCVFFKGLHPGIPGTSRERVVLGSTDEMQACTPAQLSSKIERFFERLAAS